MFPPMERAVTVLGGKRRNWAIQILSADQPLDSQFCSSDFSYHKSTLQRLSRLYKPRAPYNERLSIKGQNMKNIFSPVSTQLALSD